MSHNTMTLNGVAPLATGAVNPTTIGGSDNSLFVSIDYGVSGFAAGVGVARSWRKTTYSEQVLGTGITIGTSPRRLGFLSTTDYYETVTLPAGTWLATLKIGCTSSGTPSTTTRVALYRNDTGAIVSNIISYRDANRCPVCVAIVSGGITYEARIISGAITSVATLLAAGTAGWSFKRIS